MTPPDLLIVPIDVGCAAMAVAGTVEVGQGLHQPPGAVPVHGAQGDQAVAPGDQHTVPSRYGAGVARIMENTYRITLSYENRWRAK